MLKKIAPRPRGRKATPFDAGILLDAAQLVFAREGVDGASVRAIARVAGCDPALIYYHFAHKEAMFQALLDRKFRALIPDLEEAVRREAPLRERVENILAVFEKHLRKDAGFRALIRGQVVQGAEPIRMALIPFIHHIQGLIRDLLEEGIARGELRPDLPLPFTGFFLVRTYLEMLDLFPSIGPQLLNLPADEALTRGRQAWLDLFWRGAAHPSEAHP